MRDLGRSCLCFGEFVKDDVQCSAGSKGDYIPSMYLDLALVKLQFSYVQQAFMQEFN